MNELANSCESLAIEQNANQKMNINQHTINITPTVVSLINGCIFRTSTKLDVDVIKRSCMEMNKLIIKHYGQHEPTFRLTNSITSRVYHMYNLLMYPFPGFHGLYKKIQELFYISYRHQKNCNDVPPHFIQCWLNIVYKNDQLSWHRHWETEHKSWHGYMYINAESSIPATLYNFPESQDIITIDGKNGDMIISESRGDRHKTGLWTNDTPRISIAFDILPTTSNFYKNELNHWIPI